MKAGSHDDHAAGLPAASLNGRTSFGLRIVGCNGVSRSQGIPDISGTRPEFLTFPPKVQSEGSYLEPDTEYGYGFLEAVKEVFGK